MQYCLFPVGGTPLHEACRWFKPGVVQQLLEAGARTDTSNNQGQLPVDLVPEDEKEAKEIHKMLDKAINMITAGTGRRTLHFNGIVIYC